MLFGKKKEEEHRKPDVSANSIAAARRNLGNNKRSSGHSPSVPASPSTTAVPKNGQKVLAEVLLNQEKVSASHLNAALRKAEETGAFLGDILAKEGILDENSLVGFLSKYCRIPHLSLLNCIIDHSVLHFIPPDICWKYHLLPVDKLGRNLTVAMVNPLNEEALEVVRALCPDLRVKPILCSHEHFEIAAGRLFYEYKDHDEHIWAKLASASPPNKVSSVSHEEHSTPLVGPQSSRMSGAIVEGEETGESQIAESIVAQINSNNLLDSLFHDETLEVVPDIVEDSPTRPSIASTEMNRGFLNRMMHHYADVMIDSMKDTYQLLARKIPFFHGLFPEDIVKLFSQGKVVEWEPGHVLFKKGDPANLLYVILTGCVKVSLSNQYSIVLHEGDFIGETAMYESKPHWAEAATETPSSLLALSLDDISNDLLPQVSIQLLRNILKILISRLSVIMTSDSFRLTEENISKYINTYQRKDVSGHALQQPADGALVKVSEEYQTVIQESAFFYELFPEDITKLFSQGKRMKCAPGHVFFTAGDASDFIYLILEGKVELRLDDKPSILLGPGDYFGESALVVSGQRWIQAAAKDPCCLLALSYGDIRHIMPPRVQIQLLLNIVRTMVERLSFLMSDAFFKPSSKDEQKYLNTF